MKKNNMDQFSIPRRQSYVAIIMIIWKTYKVIFRQALPILVIMFLGGSSKGDRLLYTIVGIAIFSMIVSIINFFKFTFYIDQDELIIEKGIINRKKISIDIDRVQTINFEQNIIHSFFKVVRLKADTAGSVKDEFNLDAINIDVAKAFRNKVLKAKSEIIPHNNLEESTHQSTSKSELIMKISHKELFKAGMVENHIKSGGIIIAFFFYIYSNLQEVGVDLFDYSDRFPAVTMGVIVAVGLILIMSLISFLISMIRMVLTYYDLKLVRSGQGFSYTAGLFTKRTVSALDTKIQKITWSDNLLKKILGIFDLRFEQAASQAVDAKKSLKVPSCKNKHVQQVLNYLYPNLDLDDINLTSISPLWLKRQFLIRGSIITALSIALFFINLQLMTIMIFLGTLWVLHAFLKYRKLRFGYNEEYFLMKGGMYADKHGVFPLFKLQSIKRIQSPYMERNQVATLVFYHASGTSTIPYVELNTANQIYNFVLFKIESSTKSWM